MSLQWIAENPPQWDEPKQKIVGDVPKGVFNMPPRSAGELVPGEWWRVEDEGAVVGYGWMDCTWGDAEILLAVAPDRRKSGVGRFILEQLEREAAARGLNYMHNVVQPTHPEKDAVTEWLKAQGFSRDHDDAVLKRPVRHSG